MSNCSKKGGAFLSQAWPDSAVVRECKAQTEDMEGKRTHVLSKEVRSTIKDAMYSAFSLPNGGAGQNKMIPESANR
eukprot:COSAG02_NODE_3815_length_6192_cov_2.112260_8_plen_76_part_00